jgi:Transposase IS4
MWHGLVWKDIKIEEMYCFLGILLCISLSPTDAGGYQSYFRDGNIVVQFSSEDGDFIEVKHSHGFVLDVDKEIRMSLNRFKQIRGTFHPEHKDLGIGKEDKCYQLQAVINKMNQASRANFAPEAHLSFDEGGIACRSRYCPVQQYNKDKPDKFRVDFFALAGSKSYVIYHIDVYQGKNACNVGIDPLAVNLPTTMKAVVNAILKSEVYTGSNDSNGYRTVSLDNRYQCPQLALLLLK